MITQIVQPYLLASPSTSKATLQAKNSQEAHRGKPLAALLCTAQVAVHVLTWHHEQWHCLQPTGPCLVSTAVLGVSCSGMGLLSICPNYTGHMCQSSTTSLATFQCSLQKGGAYMRMPMHVYSVCTAWSPPSQPRQEPLGMHVV